MTFGLDEITIGFQGNSRELKQKCGHFKKEGDGLQADAIVCHGGPMLAFEFRGDTTVPIYDAAISPLHNRCVALFGALGAMGVKVAHVYWDNLRSRSPSCSRAAAPSPPSTPAARTSVSW
jgi:hypothetical protein